jgi:cellulose synthase/poly-beta-1,6-N-acetylglucosamine synthase-like glycosyltransferase
MTGIGEPRPGLQGGLGSEFPNELPSELQCLRGLLPPPLLTAAQRRAAALNISAERVLIAQGALSAEHYFRTLARHCGIGFDPLTATGRQECPLVDDRLFTASAATGLVPLRTHSGRVHVVAPAHAGHFVRFLASNPRIAADFRLTTRTHLQRYVMRHAAPALAADAVSLLARRHPAMSAMPVGKPLQPRALAAWIGATAMLAGIAFAAPSQLRFPFEALLAIVFIAWAGLRFAGLFMSPPIRRYAPLPDRDLPTYSIIVALYREAASVAGLVQALEDIDYPREKLDIKIVLEPDDLPTRDALGRLALRPEFEILLAPPSGPRTKPKALNAALPFVTGAFVVVYDAEDRPEPNQLRAAAAKFFANSRNLACLQARLAIDNTADGWLTGFFTAEYAAQFEVFLPVLAALRAPLPLGGTSNHLRVDVLRKVGGWDSYNVTEDADLGMRLARFGYRTDVVDSVTYEEAPNRLRAWLKQRTRWFKGWMQTWLVHMRDPPRLLRELGLFSFITFQLTVGGNVLAALIHPLFLIAVPYALLVDGWIFAERDLFTALSVGLFSTSIAIGYAGSIVLGWSGLARNRLTATSWVLLLTPFHWLMLSCAGWRALIQLLRRPHHWEKTEHGLARTRPPARHGPHSRIRLLQLERHLSRIMAAERPSGRHHPLRQRARLIMSRMMPDQKYWRNSAAASSGLRLRSNGRRN